MVIDELYDLVAIHKEDQADYDHQGEDYRIEDRLKAADKEISFFLYFVDLIHLIDDAPESLGSCPQRSYHGGRQDGTVGGTVSLQQPGVYHSAQVSRNHIFYYR